MVLAALRAANLGLEVRVATSLAPSDDHLARTVEEYGIKVVRGPLEDVLHRFVLAIEDLPETAIVIRLTADNVFPDGALIQELVSAIEERNGNYLISDSVFAGMPYGVVAEAFSAAVLREADRNTDSAFDREHVTPWIIRHYAAGETESGSNLTATRRLRATIDSLADYERVATVFAGIADPVSVSWRELCLRLSALCGVQVPARLIHGEWASELILGTAQLGLPDYGRANSTGQPDHPAAVALIREAVARGVDGFDTARAYGSAECVLGDALTLFGDCIRVVTKLDPLDDLKPDASRRDVRNAVDASVFRSCRELHVKSLPLLLLHRWAHRTRCDGSIWDRLRELKAEGVIGRLGVSVTSPAEASEALHDSAVNTIQLPFNLLDHRWQAAGVDRLAQQRGDVTVHARSIFLQGVLAASASVWPPVSDVQPSQILVKLDELAQQLGRADRVDLCLAFVRAQSWVHSLVIGVETMNQLHDLVRRFQYPPLSADEADTVRQSLPPMPEELLNPSLWPEKVEPVSEQLPSESQLSQ